MEKSGIYILEWDNCCHYYIGQSRQLYKRRNRHFRLLKRGIHENKRLNHTYSKYGQPKFTIVELCENENLDIKEQLYLDLYYKDPFCCNLSKNVISFKGHKHTEETKKLIGQKSKLKVYTEEYRKNLSDAQKIRYSNPNTSRVGIPRTEQQKLAVSLRFKGKKLSEEQKLKMKLNSGVALRIKDLQNNIIYNSMTELAKILNRDRSYLSKKIKEGKYPQYIIV